MEDWIEGWEAGIVPLRQQEGFEIVGAWVDRPRNRFVWLVGYSAPDGFEAAEKRYHDRPERLAQDPNPSDFVKAATLDMVDALL
jgi:hypothetical protein